jgi:hypothetical protein
MYKSPVRTIRTCKILRLNTVRLHNGVSRNLHSHVSWEPQKRQKVVEAWCRAGVTTAGVEVPRPSGQRDTACACGSLSRTDGRYTSKYLLCKESVRFIFLTVLSSTPFFPLNNSPCCLRLFSRLKSPSVCQRHVWRRCAQPSAIHCCCDTYRVHSACRRLPRIFYQSCQRCT